MKKNHKASGGKADEFLPEPFVLCYGDEENARIYAVHLTTANQSEIRGSVSCLCNGSVMVMSHGAFYFLCEDGTPIGSI